MKNYLAIFTGSAASMDAWKTLDEATRAAREKAGMQAWEEWATRNASVIVDHGAPLGKTKRVTSEGIADIRNAMAAYSVVRAESQEAAAKLFENHPHFAIFPGESVEVMPILPIPGGG